ncbi:lytic transglycosylase domain-containing protein [Burkholderia cenocepacia]|uniref:lytic transglycosylase domain-containing protein n=1 Tax=Burkholderia cenocepacia TaxID=95486 RepID=UPI00223796BB|nr:lytic transglycosylase domain-containing protein [Burkholderia cenocepacia]MCW5141056.1 lytic transglycosylase domain-containing protein [Burkholderia cenocepacia]
MPADYSTIIDAAGRKWNVDPRLISSIVHIESRGNPRAVSEVGAQGLTQLMPATQKALGVKDPFDPVQAINGAAQLLRENLNRYGNVQDAVLAYHGGTDRANWGPKTQSYLQKVTAAYGGAPAAARAPAADVPLPGIPSAASAPATPTTASGGDPFAALMGGGAPAAAAGADPFDALMAPAKGAAATSVQPAGGAAPASSSWGGELGRQLGLTARAAGHGIADAVNLIGEPINATINAVTGAKLQAPGAVIRRAVDAVTPAPRSGVENVVGDLAGAAANPANLLTGGPILAGARSVAGAAARGAIAGGASAGMEPLRGDNTVGDWFGRIGTGAAAGGALGGAGGAAARALGPSVNRLTGAASRPTAAAAADMAEQQIQRQAAAAGIDLHTVNPDALVPLRRDVANALQRGQQLDAAARLRQMDFNAARVDPTLGQLTRDPMQFTREKNLRGVEGVGEPLAQRFASQNNALQRSLQGIGGPAQDAYPAGNMLMGRLRAADDPARARVNELYSSARDSAGRPAAMDHVTFTENANNALDQGQLQNYVPEPLRRSLNDFASGRLPFNVDTAVQFDQLLSRAQRTAQRAGDGNAETAIGVIRNALNDAPIGSEAGREAKAAFDAARAAARERFATIERTPALRAALDPGTNPDKFVSQYVVNGSTRDLRALRDVLANDPEAVGAVRAQIVDHLSRKAFGANAAGDASFAQARFNDALRTMGRDKLSTFFSPDEVAQLHSIGRVGAYINGQPAGSAVNNSNTAAGVMNLLSALRVGGETLLAPIHRGVSRFQDNRALTNALRAEITPTAAAGARGASNPLLMLTTPAATGLTRPNNLR